MQVMQNCKDVDAIPYAERQWPWEIGSSKDNTVVLFRCTQCPVTPNIHGPGVMRKTNAQKKDTKITPVQKCRSSLPRPVTPYNHGPGTRRYNVRIYPNSSRNAEPRGPGKIFCGLAALGRRKKKEGKAAFGCFSTHPAQCASAQSSCISPSPRRTCAHTFRRRAGRGGPGGRQSR